MVFLRSSLDGSTEQPDLRTMEVLGRDSWRGLGTDTKNPEEEVPGWRRLVGVGESLPAPGASVTARWRPSGELRPPGQSTTDYITDVYFLSPKGQKSKVKGSAGLASGDTPLLAPSRYAAPHGLYPVQHSWCPFLHPKLLFLGPLQSDQAGAHPTSLMSAQFFV